MDALVIQEFISNHFGSVLGVYELKITEVIEISTVSLRSVWLLACWCHLFTSTLVQRSWLAISGIPGFPEFLLTIISSSTIFAQVRVKSWRNSTVLHVHEVPWSPALASIRTIRHHGTSSVLYRLLTGTIIDVQFLTTTLLITAGVMALFTLTQWICRRRFQFQLAVVTTTKAPYSAGILWERNIMVISWYGNLISRTVSPDYSRGREDVAQLDKRGVNSEALILLMNLTAMTDPLTFLRLRIGRGFLLGLFESKLSHRCYYLPLCLQDSQYGGSIAWDKLQLITVVNSKDLDWSQLLHCG
ncbi:hypothetical protein PINS_up005598 [Pythium insidiosum]|nr:hypothetical protein PINS_up005598 [Pythium insidiosum]